MTQPWYWRSLPLKNRTGSDIVATLFGSSLWFYLLFSNILERNIDR